MSVFCFLVGKEAKCACNTASSYTESVVFIVNILVLSFNFKLVKVSSVLFSTADGEICVAHVQNITTIFGVSYTSLIQVYRKKISMKKSATPTHNGPIYQCLLL